MKCEGREFDPPQEQRLIFFFSPNFFSIAAMLFLFFFCEEKSGLYFKTEPESHGAPLRLRVRSILSGFEF